MRAAQPSSAGRSLRLAAVAALLAGSACAEPAKEVPSPPDAADAAQTAPAAPASAPAADGAAQPVAAGRDEKDVVLDTPTSPAGAPELLRTPVHDAANAAALADLGLALLRAQAAAAGDAQHNRVLSPYSVANALALAHAAAAGETRSGIASVLASRAAGDHFFLRGLPSLIAAMPAGADAALASANRLWVAHAVAPAIAPPFASTLRERYRADAAVVDFGQPEAARAGINQWVAERTAGKIDALLAKGAISASTRLVLTNAVHFKSAWETPFDPARTAAAPFHLPDGKTVQVPTMRDTRNVRQGRIDNVTVYELPFAGAFSLLVGLPPPGHSLDALQKDLAGLDLASWSSQLEDERCELSLPRWKTEQPAFSLKDALQGLGMSTAFSPAADFSGALGDAGKDLRLDDALHAATIVIDEAGGEATAATAITAVAKSLAPPTKARQCAIDRPFLFAIVHQDTGVPVFVGTVARPGE